MALIDWLYLLQLLQTDGLQLLVVAMRVQENLRSDDQEEALASVKMGSTTAPPRFGAGTH